MTTRILVVWGSKRGGTEGIARLIGDELGHAGFGVEIRPAREVTRGQLDGIDAVLVGGALYANRWHRDARRFVSTHAHRLRELPVWLFSSGPLDDSAASGDLPPTPAVLALMHRIGAQGHETFGGLLAPDARGFPASAMAKKHAGDHRDPERIRAWARELAEALPDAKPYGAIPLPGGSLLSVVAHALAGWAVCALTLALTLAVAPRPIAFAVHAAIAAVTFALLAAHYFRLPGARAPLPTAAAFVSVVVLADLIVVAGIVLRSLAMFTSFAGTWLALLLIFCATLLAGTLSTLRPRRRSNHELAQGSVLVVVGHPSKRSFTAALAEAYRAGVGPTAEILYVGELSFDPSLHEGYREITPLEPDLVRTQAMILAAKHIVFFHPHWWGGMPAILKGFIDRTLLPGFAFRHHDHDPFADGLLEGRSAEIWLTSDSPRVWFFVKYWNSPIRAFKTATLEFCGIRPVTVEVVDRVRYLDERARRAWLFRARWRGVEAVASLRAQGEARTEGVHGANAASSAG